jgi:hypothetical protein
MSLCHFSEQQAIGWARKNPHLFRIIHLTDAVVA